MRTADKDGVNDHSTEIAPVGEADWAQWVSATGTRNFLLKDPVLDWLGLFGRANGFTPEREATGYDSRTDFLPFILRQGQLFERAVLGHMGTKSAIAVVAAGWQDIRSLDKARETLELMRAGTPVIAAAVLWNPADRTYGSPDLLIRSDILAELFPGTLAPGSAALGAPGLGASSWHYRVVDIKFTTLHLSKTGHAANDHVAYMAQTFIYNEALGRLQGFIPEASYLLGRGWAQGGERGRNCMERLARVDTNHAWGTPPVSLQSAVTQAVAWMRRLRQQGREWQVLPTPTVPELRPNMKNGRDQPWHAAKANIASDLEDLTLLWWVGIDARETANANGMYRWTDPRCSAASLGITGESRPLLLDAIISVNQSTDGDAVRPLRVHAAEDEWRTAVPLEFCVDFETVSNLADDFSLIPGMGGQELIFMIGCGHMENGAWKFQCFTAESLTEPAEEVIVDEWFAYMSDLRKRLSPGREPLAFHWSPAETTTLETGFRSAQARHPEKRWPNPKWFDFLKRVIKAEPVVIRGALGFGLKSVAKAMHRAGLVDTVWEDGPTDGLGAMVGAWSCSAEAAELRVALGELELMKEIERYNEVDCRVMMEVVRYLRDHH